MQAFLKSKNKVNIMNLKYTQSLDFKIWKTNIRAQKIDDFGLKIFKIMINKFLVKNKINKAIFLENLFNNQH